MPNAKLSDPLCEYRCRMLGYIWRSDENRQLISTDIAVETDKLFTGPVGRLRCNMFRMKDHLNRRESTITNLADLNDVREIVRSRGRWKNQF